MEEILKLIDDYWKFDDNQRPMSSWHEKQSLLEEIKKVGKSFVRPNVVDLLSLQNINNQILIMEALRRDTSYPHIDEEMQEAIKDSEMLLKKAIA